MSGPPTAEVYRIDWVPGTDWLHGICHCGAENSGQDPVEMWEWMLAHPVGHAAPAAAGRDPVPGDRRAEPADHRPRQKGAAS